MNTIIRPTLNYPQAQFIGLSNKFRAFVAGFGSGKTWVGCAGHAKHFYEFPRVNSGYFAPSYGQIRDIFYPTVEEAFYNWGLSTTIKETNHEVIVSRGRIYLGMILCRSMDVPSSIVGFKIGHAQADEIDLMPTDKAQDAWNKIIARMRYNVDGLKNGIDVTTTPEGFRFVHRIFVQQPAEKPELKVNYGLIQASTYENEANLPPDYIPSLIEAYPKELIEAYLNGQFVNLTSGTVYRNYDRNRCGSTEVIRPGEPLFIGMDFNVQHMAACIHVQRPNGWHRVAELKDLFDTPDMVRAINERWRPVGGTQHRIVIYPDASGKSRKSVDASKSDIALLQDAGFEVRALSENPAVKDRINAANKAFEDGRYHVNATACPWGAQCLEQQAYNDNGEPDKTSGFDHMNEAGDYFINYEMPIVRPFSKMAIAGY
ncbi:MAG: terminase family protein [Syntrophales bacterium]|nr:terminase family protein [Syntrophales bacterium]